MALREGERHCRNEHASFEVRALLTQGRSAQEASCDTRLEGFEIQAKSYLELVSDRNTLAAYCIVLQEIR